MSQAPAFKYAVSTDAKIEILSSNRVRLLLPVVEGRVALIDENEPDVDNALSLLTLLLSRPTSITLFEEREETQQQQQQQQQDPVNEAALVEEEEKSNLYISSSSCSSGSSSSSSSSSLLIAYRHLRDGVIGIEICSKNGEHEQPCGGLRVLSPSSEELDLLIGDEIIAGIRRVCVFVCVCVCVLCVL